MNALKPIRFFLVLGLLLQMGDIAAADNKEGLTFLDTGPLRIRDPLILTIGFLSPEPKSADVLPKGKWQLDLVETINQNFAMSDEITKLLEARDQRAALDLPELQSLFAENPDRGIERDRLSDEFCLQTGHWRKLRSIHLAQ